MPAPKRILDYRGHFKAPFYATFGAAGVDLTADITEAVILDPLKRITVPTGLWPSLPPGMEMQVRPKSGLAANHGVTVLNGPGTIDPDYRGEVGVVLINLGATPFKITPGMKIAQGVFAYFTAIHEGFTDETQERTGGWGSTGTH